MIYLDWFAALKLRATCIRYADLRTGKSSNDGMTYESHKMAVSESMESFTRSVISIM